MATNAIDQLLADLERRAATEIDAVLDAARSEAARLVEVARAAAEEKRAAAMEACDRQGADERHAALGDARRAGRAELLAAQHALVDRVFARARIEAASRLLETASTPRIASRIEELAGFIPGAVEVHCPPPLVSALQARLDDGARFRVSPGVASDVGVTLVGDDGRLRIEDTVDSWLAATRADHAIWICRAIDPPHESSP